MKIIILITILTSTIIAQPPIIDNCVMMCKYETNSKHPIAKVYGVGKIKEQINNWCKLLCKYEVI